MEVIKKTILQIVTTGTTGGDTIIIPDLTKVYHMKIGLIAEVTDIGFFDAFGEFVPVPTSTTTTTTSTSTTTTSTSTSTTSTTSTSTSTSSTSTTSTSTSTSTTSTSTTSTTTTLPYTGSSTTTTTSTSTTSTSTTSTSTTSTSTTSTSTSTTSTSTSTTSTTTSSPDCLFGSGTAEELTAVVINDQSFDVYENSPNSTFIGDVISPDDPNVTYSIIGGNTGNTMSIASNNGDLTVGDNTLLVYDTHPLFSLDVKVTSIAEPLLTDTAIISVNVLKVCTAATTYDLRFVSSSGGIGAFSVGKLTGNTLTITDYVIEWRNGSRTGDVVFISGMGTDVAIQAQHPFVNEPVEGGTLYPVIKYVIIGGVTYTSIKNVPNTCYSPDLITYISPIVVQAYNCSNGTTGTYSHILTYINTSMPADQATRSFRFIIGNDTTEFAFMFYGYSVADRITIKLVSNDVETTMEDWVVGDDNIADNLTSMPRIYKNQWYRGVIDLKQRTYVSGDYLKITVAPSYNVPSQTDTNWQLQMKCFTTALPFNYAPASNSVNYIDPNSFVVTWNNANCAYDFDFVTGAGPASISSTNVGTYMRAYFYWSVNWQSAQRISIPRSTYGGWGWIKGGYTYTTLNGVMTIKKVGSTLTYSFTNATDYNNYKSGYNTTIANANWTNYSTDTQSANHYKLFEFDHRISMTGGDTYTTKYMYFGHDSIFTFDDINYKITINMAQMPNEYIDQTCSNVYEIITSGQGTGSQYVSNFIASADFEVSTILGEVSKFDARYLYTGVLNATTYDVDLHLELPFPAFYGNNAPNLLPNWYLYGNAWKFHKYYLRIEITNNSDPINNYKIYSRLNASGYDTGVWTLIKSVP